MTFKFVAPAGFAIGDTLGMGQGFHVTWRDEDTVIFNGDDIRGVICVWEDFEDCSLDFTCTDRDVDVSQYRLLQIAGAGSTHIVRRRPSN